MTRTVFFRSSQLVYDDGPISWHYRTGTVVYVPWNSWKFVSEGDVTQYDGYNIHNQNNKTGNSLDVIKDVGNPLFFSVIDVEAAVQDKEHHQQDLIKHIISNEHLHSVLATTDLKGIMIFFRVTPEDTEA